MKRISLITFIFLICSCTDKKFNEKDAFLAYLVDKENGYLQKKEINGIAFTLMYKPTDLMTMQELDSSVSFKDIRTRYDDYIYFLLSMSRNNSELLNSTVGNSDDFGRLVNKLSFEVDSYVHLFTEDRDTLMIADFIYPRLFGMSNSTSILLVYPRDKGLLAKSDFLNLTVQDIGFFTGEVRFKISTKLINNEPKLNF
ncbi:MAG: hypothetical protein U1C58_03215 [Flavobacteriaceae bacterium]|nr:hypothetical protein [Flavobacteriaceae bacterium]